jgi:hypothetical protein
MEPMPMLAVQLTLAFVGTLLVLGLIALHLRLRNPKTLSSLASLACLSLWLYFGESLVRNLMPVRSATSDAAALSQLGDTYLVFGAVAAALGALFGVSFLLAALSCPRAPRAAV